VCSLLFLLFAQIVINETNLVKAYTRQNPTIVKFPDNGLAIAWESLDPDTGFSTIQAR
jgi:hypothetical protein